MQVRRLGIDGAFEVRPAQHRDDRGLFLEWFRADVFQGAAGQDLTLAQANCSVSRVGVVRGIHYTAVPPGQAKYVTCVAGSVWDVVVDLRVGSPTFGQWEAVVLDDDDRGGLYLPEGLGHGFMATSATATVVYLCSTPYAPELDHGIDPFDDTLAIEWPSTAVDGTPLTAVLSDKDRHAPGLREQLAAGALPAWSAA